MGNLVLNSLEIQRFRGFRHLQIERLGRVNLIVGKNNVGKSSLLEALRLYAYRAYPTLMWEILRERDESIEAFADRYTDVEKMLSSLKYLFYSRAEIRAHPEPFQIGPVNSPESTLSVGVDWQILQTESEGGRKQLSLFDVEEKDTANSLMPRFSIQIGTEIKVDYPLRPVQHVPARLLGLDLKGVNTIFVEANGFTRKQIGELWSSVSLTSLEKEILAALQIVAPGVEALNIVGESAATRTIIVKVASIDHPIPLRSLGNGMLRMLSIALALVNARDGLLLIDEIENGLHYLVQKDLWDLIFKLARRLNVQVFATTHSWDCIEGFQEIAREEQDAESVLTRLQGGKDGIEAITYDKEELCIATRERIEVR